MSDPGSAQGDAKLSWRVRLRMRMAAMSPRALTVNLALAVLLIIAIVGAVLTLGDSGEQTVPARTATVSRGTVTASVTANGNVISSLTTPANFAASGTITAINVKPGDTVAAGDVIATIEPVDAQADLRIAQAELDSALAAYREAEAGATDVQKQQDQLAVEQAKQEVANSEAAVRKAEEQLELDEAATETAISNAKAKLELDEEAQDTAVDNAQEAYDACRRGSSSSSSSSGGCSAEEQALTGAKQTRESVLEADQQAITTAEQQRKNTLLQSSYAIETAKQGVIEAQNDVRAAELTAQENLTPQTPEQIAQAKAAADAARVRVEMAERAVDQTELKAPQAGAVLEVNGRVGETTGPNGNDNGADSDNGSSGASSSNGSGSSDSGSSGAAEFISIANLSRLAVETNIAEADAAKVVLGQRVDVTFPATGATVTGSVTQKTPQSVEENDVVFFPVTVSLDTASPDVGAGSTASMSINAGSVDNVLTVPSAAVTTVGNNHTVTLRRGGVDTVVPVEVGLVGSSTTEITGGLAEGDVVVLPSPTVPQGAGGGLPPRGGGGR